MTATEQRNRKFLADLFAGPFRGHGIIISPPPIPISAVGDFTISDRSVQEWVPWAVKGYEDQVFTVVPWVFRHNPVAGSGCVVNTYGRPYT